MADNAVRDKFKNHMLSRQAMVDNNSAVPAVSTTAQIVTDLLYRMARTEDFDERMALADAYSDESSLRVPVWSYGSGLEEKLTVWNAATQVLLDTGATMHRLGILLLTWGYYDAYMEFCSRHRAGKEIVPGLSVAGFDKSLAGDGGVLKMSSERVAWIAWALGHEGVPFPEGLLNFDIPDEKAFELMIPFVPDDVKDSCSENPENKNAAEDWICPKLRDLMAEEQIGSLDLPFIIRIGYALPDGDDPSLKYEAFPADTMKKLHDAWWDFCRTIGQDSFICEEVALVDTNGKILIPREKECCANCGCWVEKPEEGGGRYCDNKDSGVYMERMLPEEGCGCFM